MLNSKRTARLIEGMLFVSIKSTVLLVDRSNLLTSVFFKLAKLIKYTVCASTFSRTDPKFDRTSTDLACSEPKIVSEIMSLQEWVVLPVLRVLYLNEPYRQMS
jgi:hypothetical protein